MKTVVVQDTEADLAEILDAVEHGETVVIERGSRPIARIVPAEPDDGAESRGGEGNTRFVLDLIDQGRRDTVAARFLERYVAAEDEDAAARRRIATIDDLLQHRKKHAGQFQERSIRELIDEGRRI